LTAVAAHLWQLDISSTDVTGTTVLFLPDQNISDLTGVEYFTNLTDIIIYNNVLTSIAPVASLGSLQNLDCSNNYITAIDTLPPSLRILSCNNNASLSRLPVHLPPMLTQLQCGADSLTSIPALPSGLQTLSCDGNYLDSLPSLPPTLTQLSCQNDQTHYATRTACHSGVSRLSGQ
jgi:Leucine-rich repeat (LRR) protein